MTSETKSESENEFKGIIRNSINLTFELSRDRNTGKDVVEHIQNRIRGFTSKGISINTTATDDFDARGSNILHSITSVYNLRDRDEKREKEVFATGNELVRFLVKEGADPWQMARRSNSVYLALDNFKEGNKEGRKLLEGYMSKTMPQALKDKERTVDIVTERPDVAHTIGDAHDVSFMAHALLNKDIGLDVAKAFLKSEKAMQYANEEAYHKISYLDIIHSKYPGLLKEAEKNNDTPMKARVTIKNYLDDVEQKGKKGLTKLVAAETAIEQFPQLQKRNEELTSRAAKLEGELGISKTENTRLSDENTMLGRKLYDASEKIRGLERNERTNESVIKTLGNGLKEAKERIAELESQLADEKSRFRFRREKKPK